jgi:hypothetical protein
MLRKPVIIEGNPFIADAYRKSSSALLEEVGGNTGNLAFRYAVNDQFLNASHRSWSNSANEIRDVGDVVVLPLANQLGKHTDLGSLAVQLREIGLPVVGVGLGAQSNEIGDDVWLTDGTHEWLKTILSLRVDGEPNIGVRGEYTKSQIERWGYTDSVVVTGCPSNFINLSDDIAAQVSAGFKRKGRRIAVAAGIPYISGLAKLESQLADIVTLTDGAYIVQHDLEMLQIARNDFDSMGPGLFELTHDYVQPFLTADEFRSWCRRYAFALLDVRYWMDFLKRFDFVVGTRFHGVMLAIQAGVPAGCIAHDSRTFEMCETMGVPVCRANEINGAVTQSNIRDLFSFDAEAYKAKRRRLASAYCSIARGAGLRLKPTLHAWAE